MLERDTEELRDAIDARPEEKARQTFALMRSGFAFKRAQLRVRHPDASEEAIERLFVAWLNETP